MDILERIFQLRNKKGWSEYKLSEESGVPQSTISSWYRKGAQPTLSSLKAIAHALEITLPQLLNEENTDASYLTENEKRLISAFTALNKEQQEATITLLECLNK